MTQTTLIGGAPQPVNPNTFKGITTDNYPIGTPLTQAADGSGRFSATDASTAAATKGPCVGLAASAMPGGDVRGHIQFAGPLTLTADQWDEVIDGGGALSAGSTYYTSATEGTIKASTPIGHGDTIQKVGVALDSLTLLISIGDITLVP